MTSYRQQRIADLLQEELGILVSTELEDARLADALVNVTDVVVSADLRNARVYVEHSLGAAANRQVLSALAHAHTFLRRALAESLNLRYVPELTFHIDSSGERSRQIDELLDQVVHES